MAWLARSALPIVILKAKSCKTITVAMAQLTLCEDIQIVNHSGAARCAFLPTLWDFLSRLFVLRHDGPEILIFS